MPTLQPSSSGRPDGGGAAWCWTSSLSMVMPTSGPGLPRPIVEPVLPPDSSWAPSLLPCPAFGTPLGTAAPSRQGEPHSLSLLIRTARPTEECFSVEVESWTTGEQFAGWILQSRYAGPGKGRVQLTLTTVRPWSPSPPHRPSPLSHRAPPAAAPAGLGSKPAPRRVRGLSEQGPDSRLKMRSKGSPRSS